jgi:signal transduction histidine kinase
MPESPTIGIKVFVSYAREDMAFADQLVLALRDKGFEPLIDRQDIDAAEGWRRRLSSLILSSDAVAFVMTRGALESAMCRWEVEEAHRVGKKMLPLLPYALSSDTPMPTLLAELNYIHFYSDPRIPGSGFYDGVQKLERALKVDVEWLRKSTKLSEQAHEWEQQKSDDLLLRGSALGEAIAWRERAPSGVPIPHLVNSFLVESETAEVRRKAEAASLQVQRAALDTLHEAVVVVDYAGNVRFMNKAFATLWNLADDVQERQLDFASLVLKCRPLFHDAVIWNKLGSGDEGDVGFSGEMRRTDDSQLLFRTRQLPDKTRLIAFSDVTAARRIEQALRDRAEALEAADKLKTQFIEHASYNLRQPLISILGNAEMLQHNVFGPLTDRQLKQVGDIAEAASNLSTVIDNVTEWAMAETGNVLLDLGPMDIYAALSVSVQIAASKAHDTEVPIAIECDPKIGVIEADDSRVKQVVINLLANALQRTERGNAITAGAERLDGVVRIWVHDNGKSIAMEQQAGAFDSFFSGDQRGAGLGLALVRSLVEIHGGWVTLSSSPGEGMTVSCYFPIKEGNLAEDVRGHAQGRTFSEALLSPRRQNVSRIALLASGLCVIAAAVVVIAYFALR